MKSLSIKPSRIWQRRGKKRGRININDQIVKKLEKQPLTQAKFKGGDNKQLHYFDQV